MITAEEARQKMKKTTKQLSNEYNGLLNTIEWRINNACKDHDSYISVCYSGYEPSTVSAVKEFLITRGYTVAAWIEGFWKVSW